MLVSQKVVGTSSMKLSVGRMSGNLDLSLAAEERLTSWDCANWCFPEVKGTITKQNRWVPNWCAPNGKILGLRKPYTSGTRCKIPRGNLMEQNAEENNWEAGRISIVCLGLLACKLASGRQDPFTVSLQMKVLGVVVIFSHGKSPASFFQF